MKTKILTIELFYITIGSLIMSIAVNGLFIPHNLLSGGVVGISILLHFLFNFNISYVSIILNIPIFIAGYFYIRKRFMRLSLFGMLSLSLFLELTKNIKPLSDDLLVSLIFGSVIYGLGVGLIFRFNGSTGGSDIIAKIIYKYFAFSLSTVVLSINIVVIALSTYFFGLDISTYTLTAMFIISKVANFIIEGINHKRTVFIISDKYEEIAKTLMKDLHRGVTILEGSGAYTRKSRHILYCIIGTRQIARLKYLIKHIDKHAFVTVTETSQVFGNGRGFIDIENED
jgi:uncharacterized membrane-anchored protein YitT (DUF2179 family)